MNKLLLRLIALCTLIGSLLAMVPALGMGGRFINSFASGKARFAAATLGMGLGGYSVVHTNQQQYKKSLIDTKQYNYDISPHFDLKPSKKLSTTTPPTTLPLQTGQDIPKVELPSLTDFGVNTALGFGLSLAGHAEDENPVQGAVQDTTISVVSQGLAYGLDVVAGVPMELGDEVGNLVHTGITKDAMTEKEIKKAKLPSATMLMVKLGLTWGIYQGLKTLITHSTGYKCECPSLGTGFFATGAKNMIEGFARIAIAKHAINYLLSQTFVAAGIEKAPKQKVAKKKTTKKKKALFAPTPPPPVII